MQQCTMGNCVSVLTVSGKVILYLTRNVTKRATEIILRNAGDQVLHLCTKHEEV